MNPFKKVRTLRCVAEFIQAIEVLGKTVWEIEQMYHTSLPILFESEQLMVEIESELATVCCLLDKNLRCSSSYLFCTNDNDLTECVAYCKSNYKRTGQKRWVTANCIIRYIHDKEFCLLFSPKERKYNNEVVS